MARNPRVKSYDVPFQRCNGEVKALDVQRQTCEEVLIDTYLHLLLSSNSLAAYLSEYEDVPVGAWSQGIGYSPPAAGARWVYLQCHFKGALCLRLIEVPRLYQALRDPGT